MPRSTRIRIASLAMVCLMVGTPTTAHPQTTRPDPAPAGAVWTVNTVEVQPARMEQARRYYATGWLPLRREALRRGFIRSYRLLITPAIDSKNPEIVLMTQYADAAAFRDREAHFDMVFAALNIPRAIEIDGLKRADIFGVAVGAEDYHEVEAAGAP